MDEAEAAVRRAAKRSSRMNRSIIHRPSAWLPIALSLAALGVVLVHVALFGAAREADEGTAAHLWQILMAAQVPLVAFFAVRWLPRTPRQALLVLLLQAGAALAALAPVFLLNL
jgi:FtsH-binding integral membrane protein